MFHAEPYGTYALKRSKKEFRLLGDRPVDMIHVGAEVFNMIFVQNPVKERGQSRRSTARTFLKIF